MVSLGVALWKSCHLNGVQWKIPVCRKEGSQIEEFGDRNVETFSTWRIVLVAKFEVRVLSQEKNLLIAFFFFRSEKVLHAMTKLQALPWKQTLTWETIKWRERIPLGREIQKEMLKAKCWGIGVKFTPSHFTDML